MLSLAERVRLKRAAAAYARAHKIPIPSHFNAAFLGIGEPARELYRRIQHHAGIAETGIADAPLRRLLLPPPPVTRGPAYGVDVSNHQPSVDWKAVRASGARFAILKATEGSTFDDAYYNHHRQAANAQGIVVGAYHFAHPSGSGTAQAAHFWNFAKPRAGDLIPALDLEVSDGVGAGQIAMFVEHFAAGIHSRCGRMPFLYTYPAFWRGNLDNTRGYANLPLWIANYGVSHPDIPGGWHDYAIWQFTSSGSLHGVPGRVDRNIAPRGIEGLRLA